MQTVNLFCRERHGPHPDSSVEMRGIYLLIGELRPAHFSFTHRVDRRIASIYVLYYPFLFWRWIAAVSFMSKWNRQNMCISRKCRLLCSSPQGRYNYATTRKVWNGGNLRFHHHTIQRIAMNWLTFISILHCHRVLSVVYRGEWPLTGWHRM